MGLINHQHLANFLEQHQTSSLPPLVLICGESFLLEKAFDKISQAILQDKPREFCTETVDGSSIPMGDIIEQLTTFSFMGGPKLVVVKDAPLFSTARGREISYGEEEIQRLANLSWETIPEQHFLIFLSKEMDRRKKAFKLLEPSALVVDCTIPAGSQKADQEAQGKIVRSIVEQLTSQANKTIEPRALQEFTERIGHNPQAIAGNLEKLILFTGDRTTITHEDVLAIVKREKKDPIFLFTNAVLDRNADRALFYLSSLLAEQFHPLQILKSLENQIRKLLLAKYFLVSPENPAKGSAMKKMSYNEFTRKMGPAIAARDKATKDFLAGVPTSKKKSKSGGKTPGADLLLAPNPKSLYPVFQLFQKSEHFTRRELETAMGELADMDYQFKTSAISPVMVVEHFIVTLCSPVRHNP